MERVLEPEVMDTAAEADAYAAMDHRGPNQAFVARLLALGAHGAMLDVGTGPGHVPVLVCERDAGARVTAVDLAESMLVHARRLRDASPHAARIAIERADAKALPWPDASFDTVFSNTILHHIPDPLPFLCEVARVVRPGGVLLVRDLFRPDTPQSADALVARHAADATRDQQRLLRESLGAALTPRELRAVAEAAGLADAEVVVDTDRHMSLQRARRAQPGSR